MFSLKKMIFCLAILVIICFGLINVSTASDVTINSTNGTLSGVVNKYDTIYLDDGVYKGDLNKNVIVSRNTTIIGLNKGGAILDDEKIFSSFQINPKTSLTLINLTFRNRISSIDNQGALTIRNTTFINNYPVRGIIQNRGSLRVLDSTFNNNGNVLIYSFMGNDQITNCEFNNNKGGIDGIITFAGKNRNVSLVNSTFYNNSATIGLIVAMGDYLNVSISNSSFVNSKCNLFVITGGFEPSVGSKMKPSNITEINTTITYNPNIYLKVYLKKNGLLTFKASLTDRYGIILPNQRLYFYVNGKLLGSALTDKNGVATFNYKKSNLNFKVQIVLKKHTSKNSTTTATYNNASFQGSPSKFVVGKSNIIYKDSSPKKRGMFYYKKISIKNMGSSIGSKIFTKKIPSKYSLVRYTYKKVIFKYNKSKKTFSVKVKSLLPYKYDKKSFGILTLILRKK
jgi:hypothetical protein